MYYTGVDGGMTGAIATITEDCSVLFLKNMPLQVNGWYDPQELMRLFSIKEQIMGLEESYRFAKLCKGIGILWACATISPKVKQLVMVRPQQWQKLHGIKKADKNVSIEIARHLFPYQAKDLTLKKHHNRAEALLIADYMRRVHGGRPIHKK